MFVSSTSTQEITLISGGKNVEKLKGSCAKRPGAVWTNIATLPSRNSACLDTEHVSSKREAGFSRMHFND